MNGAFSRCVDEVKHVIYSANDIALRRSGVAHLIFMCGCPAEASPCTQHALAALGELAASRTPEEGDSGVGGQASDTAHNEREENKARTESPAQDFRPLLMEAGIVTVLSGAVGRRGGARNFTRAALRDAAWCFVQLTEPCADKPEVRKQLLREGALDALAAICDIAEDDATWDYASWAMHQIGHGAEDEAQRETRKRQGARVAHDTASGLPEPESPLRQMVSASSRAVPGLCRAVVCAQKPSAAGRACAALRQVAAVEDAWRHLVHSGAIESLSHALRVHAPRDARAGAEAAEALMLLTSHAFSEQGELEDRAQMLHAGAAEGVYSTNVDETRDRVTSVTADVDDVRQRLCRTGAVSALTELSEGAGGHQPELMRALAGLLNVIVGDKSMREALCDADVHARARRASGGDDDGDGRASSYLVTLAGGFVGVKKDAGSGQRDQPSSQRASVASPSGDMSPKRASDAALQPLAAAALRIADYCADSVARKQASAAVAALADKPGAQPALATPNGLAVLVRLCGVANDQLKEDEDGFEPSVDELALDSTLRIETCENAAEALYLLAAEKELRNALVAAGVPDALAFARQQLGSVSWLYSPLEVTLAHLNKEEVKSWDGKKWVVKTYKPVSRR
eukprot:g2316.t1